MMSEVRPVHLVPDIERHAVTGYAREIATACGCAVATGSAPDSGGPLHLHFTERLWGTSPEAAAARVSELAHRHRLTLTLHDVPQPSDGAASQPRRAAAYAQVMDAARAVACNSAWEAELIAAIAGRRPPPTIIPLAVRPGSADPPRVPPSAQPPTIGLLGFVYPGKGHSEAIDAAALCAESLGHRVDVVAIGAVSDGHEADAGALGERARQRQVTFSVTGYLAEHELVRLARQVTVPLAAHQHVSASASIGSWLSAGRRPLVADSAYAREIDALRPATIRRYDPARLSAAVLAALGDPAAGWLAPQIDLRPGPAETAATYLRWWSEEVSW